MNSKSKNIENIIATKLLLAHVVVVALGLIIIVLGAKGLLEYYISLINIAGKVTEPTKISDTTPGLLQLIYFLMIPGGLIIIRLRRKFK